jgi:hypothetical protein
MASNRRRSCRCHRLGAVHWHLLHFFGNRVFGEDLASHTYQCFGVTPVDD